MSGIHFSSPLHAAASAIGAFPDDSWSGRARRSRATPTVSLLLSGGFHAVSLALFLLATARPQEDGRVILTPAFLIPPVTIKTIPPVITDGGASGAPRTGGVIEPVPPTIKPPDVGGLDIGKVNSGVIKGPSGIPTGDTSLPPPPAAATTDPLAPVAYDEAPVPIYHPDPSYSDFARSAGLEGLVRLEVVVSQEGSVLRVDVKDGNAILSDLAKSALMTWKFRPGKRKGVPVTTRVAIPVRFTLRD